MSLRQLSVGFAELKLVVEFQIVEFAWSVVGVEQLMRFVAERFFQEVCISVDDERILVGFTQREVLIIVVETHTADSAIVVWEHASGEGVDDRCTTAADAAARAGHDFDEGVVSCTSFDFFHDLSCSR